MKDVTQYLREQQDSSVTSDPEIAAEWGKLEEFYNKKLWHQLTDKLLSFTKNAVFLKDNGLIMIYENFISDFEHRINPLSLMEIAFCVAKQYDDPEKSVAFLENIKEKVKGCREASILCLTAIGYIYLKQSKMKELKDIIGEARAIIDSMDGVSPVHGRFFDLCSEFHRQSGNHAEYYHDSLRFLGCININEMPESEKKTRASMLTLAALLGQSVYNFGELLAHPILDSIKNSEDGYLVEFLYAFNSGNLKKWQSLSPRWKSIEELKKNELALQQKIMLLCLMEMTFERQAKNRQLTFEEISAKTTLPLNEVEILVMKALSLGLVEGLIDEVAQKVHMTWVQPRVLDIQQLSSMQTRLDQWSGDINNMEILIEGQAQEILDRAY